MDNKKVKKYKVDMTDPSKSIDSMLSKYFRDLRKTTPLTSDDQIELAVRARGGDKRALDDLVESNLRFVMSIAKEYAWSGIPIEELASEGNIGLIRAVDKFDETKGFKFISYAVWWIRQSIMQCIYENSNVVRLPMNRVGERSRIGKAMEKLQQQLSREPTVEELSVFTEIDEDDIRYTTADIMSRVSINESIDDDSDVEFGDVIVGETLDDIDGRMNTNCLRDLINSVMDCLSEREVEILCLFFGLNGKPQLTLKEIGEHMKLTNERVRQIKEFALRKLRTFGNSSKLREYLNCNLA